MFMKKINPRVANETAGRASCWASEHSAKPITDDAVSGVRGSTGSV